MPKKDGTGPIGQGPMTGRRMGLCGGEGMGRGIGRNCQRRFLTKAEEKEVLVEEKNNLKAELQAIDERLIELEK